MMLEEIATKLEGLAELTEAGGVSEMLQQLADDAYADLVELCADVSVDDRPMTPAETEEKERECEFSWKGARVASRKKVQTKIELTLHHLARGAMNDLRDVCATSNPEASAARMRKTALIFRESAQDPLAKVAKRTDMIVAASDEEIGKLANRRDSDSGVERQSTEFARWIGAVGLMNLAIVFTDVIGSSGLNNRLGDDRWNSIRDAHFDLAKLTLAKHGGYLLKTAGDSVMAIFRSSVEALRFALEFEASPGHELVRIRAGVHVGEVTVHRGDTFGSQVALCARISSKAKEGGIWVSAQVHENWLSHDPGLTLPWMKRPRVKLSGLAPRFKLWSLPPSRDH